MKIKGIKALMWFYVASLAVMGGYMVNLHLEENDFRNQVEYSNNVNAVLDNIDRPITDQRLQAILIKKGLEKEAVAIGKTLHLYNGHMVYSKDLKERRLARVKDHDTDFLLEAEEKFNRAFAYALAVGAEPTVENVIDFVTGAKKIGLTDSGGFHLVANSHGPRFPLPPAYLDRNEFEEHFQVEISNPLHPKVTLYYSE